MRPLTRYVVLQLPGWAVAAALLVWLWPATGLGPLAGFGAFALWVAKDFAIFPLIRVGYEPGKTGVERLIGLEAIVSHAISPVGHVRLQGERWRAELAPGELPIPEGAIVEIRSASGLTLSVARRGPAPS